LAVGLGLCILASISASALAASPRACTSRFGSFSASNFPGACWRPFSADSPFNRPLPVDPVVASQSAGIISDLATNRIHFEGGGSQFALTSDDGRDGVYYAQSTNPVVTIHCTYEWGPGTCTGADKINIDGQQIHIPAGAQPQGNGSDMHMTVVEQGSDVQYDFEHATWSADHQTLNVWSGAEIPNGPNLGDGLGAGGTAAGTSTLAGLITAPELASGVINHALAISIPCTDGYVYPANGANGFPCHQIQPTQTPGTTAPLGSLMQLNMTDAQISASGAPAWEQTIMTAMAHYGLYVNDTQGSGAPDTIGLEAVSDISYTSLGGQPLLANLIKSLGGSLYAPLHRWILTGPPIDITKFRVLDPCVAQNTCPPNTGTRVGRSAHKRSLDPVARIALARAHRSLTRSHRRTSRVRRHHGRPHHHLAGAGRKHTSVRRHATSFSRCMAQIALLPRGDHRQRRTRRHACRLAHRRRAHRP
jgi:hypothetical protein